MTRKQFSAVAKERDGNSITYGGTKSFPAKYRGECAQGDRIKVGDAVRFNADDELEHVECDGIRETEATFGPVCKNENCLYWMMTHSGECQ